MPEKTVKKTATKKPVAKKTIAKPAAKKPAVKKAPAKKVAAPVVEPMSCGCKHDCACACAKKKCGFCNFLKKFIVFLIVFAMGFATANICCDGPRGKKFMRPEFENGCLVVKCEKMAEKVAMMDADKNGCVTREEFRDARRQMKRDARHQKKDASQPAAPVQAEEAAATVTE